MYLCGLSKCSLVKCGIFYAISLLTADLVTLEFSRSNLQETFVKLFAAIPRSTNNSHVGTRHTQLQREDPQLKILEA